MRSARSRVGRPTPVIAGEWGLIPNAYDVANCLAVKPSQATELIRGLLGYFREHRISWIAYAFQLPKMIQSWRTYAPTTLNHRWTRGDRRNGSVGMGAEVKRYVQTFPGA
jgi:hypothetical protein